MPSIVYGISGIRITSAPPEIPAAIDLILRREKVILDACADPGFNAEAQHRATADSADIH